MFDLDGTLIDENYVMSKKTIDALKRLKEKGYLMVANSGRPVFLSDYVSDPTLGENFFEYVYGNNGSEYKDNLTGKFELLKYLKSDEIRKIVKLFEDDMFVCGVYEPGEVNRILIDRNTDEPQFIDWYKARGLKVETIDFETNEKDYAKIICLHKKETYDEAMKYIACHQADYFKAVPSSIYAIELVPNGVSKATAVEHFMNQTGIKAGEIIAFGDSGNDMPMLELVHGVIMGNASEENKEKIKEKTLSVKEDGIYDYLKKNGYLD